MPGVDEEEKKSNASKTLIECVERLWKYNPLRARPVKVSFSNKSDADYVLKQREKLPKGVFVDKEYSKANRTWEKATTSYNQSCKETRKLQRPVQTGWITVSQRW